MNSRAVRRQPAALALWSHRPHGRTRCPGPPPPGRARCRARCSSGPPIWRHAWRRWLRRAAPPRKLPRLRRPLAPASSSHRRRCRRMRVPSQRRWTHPPLSPRLLLKRRPPRAAAPLLRLLSVRFLSSRALRSASKLTCSHRPGADVRHCAPLAAAATAALDARFDSFRAGAASGGPALRSPVVPRATSAAKRARGAAAAAAAAAAPSPQLRAAPSPQLRAAPASAADFSAFAFTPSARK